MSQHNYAVDKQFPQDYNYLYMKKLAFTFISLACFGFSKNFITVTTKPYEKLVQEIVGEEYEVRSFVPAHVDAHHFQPAFARVRAHKDTLWFGTGEPLERHLSRESLFVDLSKGQRGHHPWLDPVALKEQLRCVKETLCERDPTHRMHFESNYERLARRLDELEVKVRARLTQSKPLLAFHPSLDAFCARFGVELISLEEEGKGMSQNSYQRVAERIKACGIDKLIAAPGEPAAKHIAEKLGVEVAILDPYSDDVFGVIETAAELATR